jgi:hypothetical protein
VEKLTDRQKIALEALEKLHRGQATTFLNWTDADSLVDMGYARKTGHGQYELTSEGLALLQNPEAHITDQSGSR